MTQYLGRVPKSDEPVPRDIPQEPPQTKERRVTLEENGRCRRSSSRTTSPSTAIPDSYPLHIASKILSDGQSSRIYRKLVYEKRHRAGGVRRRQHHRGPEPVLRRGDRAAGPHAGGGDQCADRRARQAAQRAGHRGRAAAGEEPVRARLHPRPRVRTRDKAEQLGHAVVIHNDIKTADGEFDIFQNLTRRRRAARGADVLHAREPAGVDDPARRARQRRRRR